MKTFDAGKNRMIWLPYGEKTVTICLSRLATDRFAISISRVSMLPRDKNAIFWKSKQFRAIVSIDDL